FCGENAPIVDDLSLSGHHLAYRHEFDAILRIWLETFFQPVRRAAALKRKRSRIILQKARLHLRRESDQPVHQWSESGLGLAKLARLTPVRCLSGGWTLHIASQ